MSILAPNSTLNITLSVANSTDSEDGELHELLEFNTRLLLNVIGYSLMSLLGTALNLCVFVIARRQQRRSSSNVHLMIMHLAVADLCVCGCVMPIEVIWRLCVQWYAGNVACKAAMFLRAFAFYLSSTTLVCLSLDRYWAVSRPLRWSRSQGSARRARRLIASAWLASTIFALPQTIVFRVLRHPHVDFLQCTSMHFFDEMLENSRIFAPKSVESAHKALFLLAVYVVPLLVIVATYARIVAILIKREGNEQPRLRYTFRGRTSNGEFGGNRVGNDRNGGLRCAARPVGAERMALRMSVTHALAFIACWTPYLVISLWHMVDSAGLRKSLSPEAQDVLFLTAVCNSCINPVVYGLFHNNNNNNNRLRGRDRRSIVNRANVSAIEEGVHSL